MLGLGRAMGETIAAALVIGSALGQITLNPFAPGNSMPAVIANEWGEADELHKSALIALAVALFVITIVGQPDRDGDRAALDEAEPRRMTSTLDAATTCRRSPTCSTSAPSRSWRTVKNTIMTGLMVVALVLVAIPLVAVLWSVIAARRGDRVRGLPRLLHRGRSRSCRAGPARAWARRSSARCWSPAARR